MSKSSTKDPVKASNAADDIALKINIFSAGRLIMRKKGKSVLQRYFNQT